MVLKRYKAQRTRGKDGFGYIALKDGKMIAFERAAEEKDILALLEKTEADEVIFHHRMPTSTPNFAECAHPIRVSNDRLRYDYYLIHNGVISNDDELKRKHTELGFEYSTEVSMRWSNQGKEIAFESQYNDSEALAIELAIDLDKEGEGISDVTGSIAFIMLQTEKESKNAKRLYFGRNYGNPLKFDLVAEKYIALTSEGGGKDIEVNKLNCIDYETYEHTERDYKIGGYSYSYKGTVGFKGYEDDDGYDWEKHYNEQHKSALPAPETEIQLEAREGELVTARSIEEILDDDRYIQLWQEFDELTQDINMLEQRGSDEDENQRTLLDGRLTVVMAELEAIENKNLYKALDTRDAASDRDAN